jgi:hypothetical protein
MNVVRITSGLGNQLFQYAFYRALKENDPTTKMDVSEFSHRKHHYGYELEKTFHIEPNYTTKKESDSLVDVSKDFLSVLRRNLLKQKRNCSGYLIEEKTLGTRFHPQLLNKKNTYFQGFWQTEKYLLPIAKELRKELTFKQEMDKENLEIATLITSCHSVSLHIRRGDYLKKRRFDTVGSVCTEKYYAQSIQYITNQLEQPRFFVFSDDIHWVKKHLNIKQATYVDVNTGKNSFKDMQLMSLCQHNIIANSSFSWWGAWLNAHPDKIVIAPAIWFRGTDMPDIIPTNWIKMDVD